MTNSRENARRTAAALLVAALVAMTADASVAGAQTTVLAGGGVGGTLGIESADLPVYPGEPECGTFESGSSAGGSIDGRLVLPLFFAPGVGLDARLRLGLASATLTASPVDPTIVRDADGGGLVTLEREYRMERSTVASALDVLARVPAGPLVIGAGVSFGAHLSGTFERSDNILGPGAQSFGDGRTTREMAAAGEETSTFTLAPMLALGVPLSIGPTTSLVPELSARFGLLSSMPDADWRTIELGLGVAVLVDLTPAPTPITPR